MDDQPILAFQGKYRWLSNFWPVQIWSAKMGLMFPSAEHAYQACKTDQVSMQVTISMLSTPGAAKRAGKHVRIRPDWDQIKVPTMHLILREKFSDRDLRYMLMETGDAELVEGNTWGDTFWGVYDGHGQNMLGKLLMEVREEIRL